MKNNKNIYTDDLVRMISERAGFIQGDVRLILDTLVEIMKEAIKKDMTVRIAGFGKLYATLLPERKGSKGEILPPAKRIVFRIGSTFKEDT